MAVEQRLSVDAGEKLSGKNHPELIPRRVAFQMLLHLLSIQPEDAPYKQQRARLIEEKRIGLGIEDAAQLEQIVEEYRIQELSSSYKIAQILTSSSANHAALLAQHQQHLRLLNDTAQAINYRLSKSGQSALNRFLNEIISKSQVHGSSSSAASEIPK